MSKMSRVRMLALLVTISSGTAMPGAFAVDNSDSTIVFAEPFAFGFPAGTCPDLPGDLTIDFTGALRGTFHVSEDASGVFHVHGTDAITGTALDSTGATYRFNYHDAFHAQDAGFPIEFTITDHFNLVGNGAYNQLHTFFVVKILLVDPDTEQVTFENAHGDPAQCDPL